MEEDTTTANHTLRQALRRASSDRSVTPELAVEPSIAHPVPQAYRRQWSSPKP